MTKVELPPKNILYPCPVVLVTTRLPEKQDNIFTVAWTGTTNSVPPMLSISAAKGRYSHEIIEETGVFAVNLTTEDLMKAVDYCGLKSGKTTDKFKELNLEKEEASHINCPMLKDSPLTMECEVKQKLELGSHTMYNAEIVAVHVNKDLLEEKQKIDLAKTNPLVYVSHNYYALGNQLAKGGFSIKQ